DIMRVKQQRKVDGQTITTHYIDKVYEVEITPEETTQRTFIGDVAVLNETGNQSEIRFTHKDRLGSATTFTDEEGTVTAYRSFDPFGKPKGGDFIPLSALGLTARLSSNPADSDMATRRGFTDNEHLDEVELIHMNGRVYDYNVGRFLSVDPYIHEGSQGINPYSYIMNNPLSGTDPSGYKPDQETVEKTITVTQTGSRIKHRVKVSATTNANGTTTVSVSGNNGAAVKQVAGLVGAVANSINSASSGGGAADIGSQDNVSTNSGGGSEWTDQDGNPTEAPEIFNGTETAHVDHSQSGHKPPWATDSTPNLGKIFGTSNEGGNVGSPPPDPDDDEKANMRTQNHHMIPHNNSTFKHHTHSLVKQANMNLKTEQANMIRLLNHSGPHSKQYHRVIQQMMDTGYSRVAGKGQMAAQNELLSIMNRLNRGIRSGKIRPYQNKNVWPIK
ncbi:AHH domain-containing protein, partial [Alteromonas sp. 5E99-2]|uniref:RHS repeat-associated core domain-containing protein n=1 Tax=Alteromonas sp. 5E99-2 TaxID=2817683 RepID=UPI001A999D33